MERGFVSDTKKTARIFGLDGRIVNGIIVFGGQNACRCKIITAERFMQKNVKRYIMLLAGAAILSFGLFNVHAQSRITEGGVLGTTLLVQHWLGVTPAVTEVILDVICYSLGMKYLGRDFLKYALTATGGFSLSYALWERIGYILPDLSNLPVLAAIVGGIFVGVGVGLVVRAGGASGGDDALALVIAKRTGWPVSRAYLITDLTVLALSLSYIPVGNIACSVVTVTLSSFIVGKIHTMGHKDETH